MLTKRIADFLFAPKSVCKGCGSLLGEDKGHLCFDCHAKLNPLYASDKGRTYRCLNCGSILDKKRCPRCRKTTAGGMYAYSAYPYDETIRSIVHNFKYNSAYKLSKWMAQEQAKVLEKYNVEFDLIVPVPIHFARRLQRGYNQSEKLSNELSLITRIEYSEALTKIRHTKKQSRLDAEARRKSLIGAFGLKKDVKGRRILLVDDVITTGSTMIECVHTLMQGGCASVALSTFAITETDDSSIKKS